MLKNVLAVISLALAKIDLVPIAKLHFKRLVFLLPVALLFPVLLLNLRFSFGFRRGLRAFEGWELCLIICIGKRLPDRLLDLSLLLSLPLEL